MLSYTDLCSIALFGFHYFFNQCIHLYERSARRYYLNISKSSINIAEKIELVQEWSELQDLSSN